MDAYAWIVLLPFVLMSLVCLAVAVLPQPARGHGLRQAVRWQLPLTPEIDTQLEAEFRRTWATVGVGTGVAAAFLGLATPATVTDSGSFQRLLVLIGAAATMMQVLLAVRTVVRRPSGRLRIAHSTGARVRDFVALPALIIGHASVGLGCVALLLAAADPDPEYKDTVWGWHLGVIAGLLVVTAACDLLAYAIIRRPAATNDPIGLAWDEMVRGRVVRTTFAAPLPLVLLAALLAVMSANENLYPLGLACMVLQAIASIVAGQPRLRSQRWLAVTAAARAAVPVR